MQVCEWVQFSVDFVNDCVEIEPTEESTTYNTCNLQYGYTKELNCDKIGIDESYQVTFSSPDDYASKTNASNACASKTISCGVNGVATSIPICSTKSSYRKVVYKKVCE